jgi:TRAP-type uncharacterized transport system fused permease subunit
MSEQFVQGTDNAFKLNIAKVTVAVIVNVVEVTRFGYELG